MAKDKPCTNGCGRMGRATLDTCAVCGGNHGKWKGETPAQRMRYRQRLGLATRRQESYREEFGDPARDDEINLTEIPKASVTHIGPYIKKRNSTKKKSRRRA